MKLILDGILESIQTRQDNSLKLTIGTQETDPKQAGDLFGLRNKYIKLLLSDNNIKQMDEQLVDNFELTATKKTKSPGQRQRNVIYKYWQSQGSPGDFDTFYANEVERIIESYKGMMQ